MRKLIIYFMIIFLFFLPKFAIADESFIVKPLPSLMAALDLKGKKSYQEFCDSITGGHEELNRLFMTDYFLGNPDIENSWLTVCERAKTDIKRGRGIITYVPKGSEARLEGVKWFNSLMSLFRKLSNQGVRAFGEKVAIGKIIQDKGKSLKRNRTIKRFDQDDIDSIDKMIGYAKAFQNADDKERWLNEYKSKNSGKTFRQELLETQIYGKNVASAVLRTKKYITQSAKDDEPDLYEGGEGHLDGWGIDHEYKYFSNFKNVRFSWQEAIKESHKEYEKIYETWYDELEYIFNDTIFKDTKYMKGWKWNNLSSKFGDVVLETNIYRN